MQESLENALYGTTLLVGLGCGALGMWHRGHFHFDPIRKVNVANGDGLSAKIIEKFPKYQRFSPIVDHILAGIGVPAITAGYFGLCKIRGIGDFFMPYEFGTYLYIMGALTWEGITSIDKRMKLELSDLYQILTDVSVPLTFLYVADHTTRMF